MNALLNVMGPGPSAKTRSPNNKNKKDTVTDYLKINNIQLCCLQETEVLVGFPDNILNCGGYNIELEQNSVKKRVSIYLQKDLNYVRRFDLEKEDHHIVIVDVKIVVPFRVISIYRSFRPQGGIQPESLFNAQLGVLRGAVTKNCFVMGDFNLDVRMELRSDYLYKSPYNMRQQPLWCGGY